MNISCDSSFVHNSTHRQDSSHVDYQDSDGDFRDLSVIRHDYHDYSGEVGENPLLPRKRGGHMPQFPTKLHSLLEIIEKDGYGHIMSWQPHGRCFVIHKPTEFSEFIMPFYFKQSKVPSFQRQLNLYGFQRLTKGPDKGGYYHELFLRGKIFLAERIGRMRIKGNGVRSKSNPDAEPNFQSMPPVTVNPRNLAHGMKEDPQSRLKIEDVDFVKSNALMRTIQASQTNRDPVMHLEFGGMDFPPLEEVNVREHGMEHAVASNSQILMPFLQHINFPLDLYSDIVKCVESDEDYADLIFRLIQ